MPNNTYTPGAVTTVGDLEVGDTIFLRERASVGGPAPIAPAIVTALHPKASGRIDVSVHPANSTPTATRSLGALPPTREFRLAALAARTPVAPTKIGNVVTIPASEQFSYRDNDGGSVLTAGPVTLLADLHVTTVPNAGYSLDSGATAAWTFTYTPE